MLAERSHDEDQFIASAVLLLRNHLLPYRDYPYFHLPNLTFLYAGVIFVLGHPFFSARLINAIAGTLTVLLIFLISNKFNHLSNPTKRCYAPYLWALILEFNPLFIKASSLSWNHAVSGMLATGAFFCYYDFVTGRQKKPLWIFLSGILVGLAAGTRASFSLIILPLFLATSLTKFHPGASKQTKLLPGMFLFGVLISLIPTIYTFLQAPKSFIFGNLVYAQLNTRYRIDTGFTGPISLLDRIAHFEEVLVNEPGNLLLALTALHFGLLFLKNANENPNLNIGIYSLLFSLALFALIGSFLPSPSWYQYFYAPIPWIILFGAYSMACFVRRDPERSRWSEKLLLGVVCFILIASRQELTKIKEIVHLNSWQPVCIHTIGENIKQIVGKGTVLTLAPVFPLEAGLEIYPALTTGPFAWRTGYLLSERERQNYGILNAGNLERTLRTSPPDAILVGLEGKLEKPLIDYALANNFSPFSLENSGITVWVAK